MMQQDKHYRHEYKYEIPYADYAAMRGRLNAVMKPDPHTAANGKYMVRSIYFDNSDDKALREKTEGFPKREKFRIRYYNDDLSRIVLEKKIKTGRLTLKCDALITEDECRSLLAGNVRITFDSCIRTSLFTREFLSHQSTDISATDMPQDMILEVKYDAFLPGIIQDIIQSDGIRQQA